MTKQPAVYRTPRDPGFVGGYNWTAMLAGLLLLVLVNFAATQFIAYRFRYQRALGAPLLQYGARAVYQPFAWGPWVFRHASSPNPRIRLPLLIGAMIVVAGSTATVFFVYTMISHHIVKGLGDTALRDFSLTMLQGFLESKAASSLSFSVVDHLRWDLSAIFEMAVAEKVIATNPATRLYTPKYAPRGETRAMTVQEVNTALGAVELREQILLHMAIFSGFRPGEMLALQRRHVSADATVVKVEQRVYRGDIADPKTEPSKRQVAIPPRTAELLLEWMNTAIEPDPNAYLFAGEKGRPVWRDTLLYDHIRPKLEPHGLGWVNFQVMRATHASIGHRLKLDPKVTADQRRHGVGVAIEEYTKTSVKDRAAAAKKLEQEVLGKPKVVRMPRRKAS